MKTAMTLRDPAGFERAYDQHARGVYRALGSQAQAQDVVQDVFLKLWREPGKFDARRGELGSYLRLMARSRALDTWREGQAAGRASDRLKLDVALDEGRPDERPAVAAERDGEWRTLRDALRGLPASRSRGARTSRSVPRRAAFAWAWRACASTSRPLCPGSSRPACSLRRAVPVNASQFDQRLLPVFLDGRDHLAKDDWFDAHTHIGQNDPDGRKATPEEILGGLDAAGHRRAMLFAMHEPDGYPAANDAVLAAAAASEGRFVALARIAPNSEGAVAEARRCLEAGASGFKLHPRSDAFGLPHPVVEEVVALADERRAPVLFHAGRGIPHLGEAVVDLARRYPGARLILAHAGISDLGWIADEATALDNLFFDTAWWNVADQLQLYTTIPPGRILYASDMPYAPGLLASFVFLRVARAVGHGPDVIRSIAWWSGRTPSTWVRPRAPMPWAGA